MAKGLKGKSNIWVAIFVVMLLGIMILPMPPIMLDLLLSISISIGVVILVTAVFIEKPMDFNVFPSVLLLTTIYRLSLNVASTRIILMKGNEGPDAVSSVIKSFGEFVVGGNYVVGIVVFLVLAIVNFYVIAHGAVRIAEVAARFTLDAMPGKQMAIDADLNTGLIDDAEARRRRELVAQEADFYGSMDGASRFVSRDAMAGLIIVAINIVGGLLIGTIQHGMPIMEAAKTFTLLTVGDGLVAQIPALMISTSAGIIVSRAGMGGEFGTTIGTQLFKNYKVLFTTGTMLTLIGMVPGLPHLPFMALGISALVYAYFVMNRKETPTELEESAAAKVASPEEPKIESMLELDPLALEIGYGLIPLVEEQSDLLGKLKSMRRNLAGDFGFIVPPIHIKDNLQLRPHEYSFLLRGVEIGRGEVMMGSFLAVQSEGAGHIEGIPTKEPAFGLPAFWIDEASVEDAQMSGYMVVDSATVIVTHITELVKRNAWELLSRGEVQNLLDNVTKVYPKLVDELVPSLMSLGGVQRVLQGLLRENVPIKDFVTILECLLDFAPMTKDNELLTEQVRQSLSRQITKKYIGMDGSLPVFTVDPRFERAISQSMQGGEAVSPDMISRLLKGIERSVKSDTLRGAQPIILCSAQVRRLLRKILDKFMPTIVVLSNAEIAPSAKIYTLGMVKYED